MAASWQLEILKRLRERNSKETSSFKELVLSHGRLFDQVENLKKEITRLEYQNNELERDIREGVGGGGGGGGNAAGVNKLNKRIEDLHDKLLTKTNEVSEAHRTMAEAMGKVTDLSGQLRSKDDEISKRDTQINNLTATQKKLEEKITSLEENIKINNSTHSRLMDEHSELQLEFNSQDKKLKELQYENDRLRSEVLRMKAQEAERVNKTTEIEKAEREKIIKKQIEEAARPKTSFTDSLRVKTKPTSPDFIDPSAVYPSVIPEKVFFNTEAHDGELSALSFSLDGQFLATGGADKSIKIWGVRPEEDKVDAIAQLYGSGASIMSVQFDHINKFVLAASNDFATRLWTLGDQRPRHTLTGHSGKVFSAKFMDDSQRVVTGSQDKTLKIWDLKQRRCFKTLFAGSSCCDLVPAQILGNMIISGHWDKKIRFWDLRVSSVNPSHELAIQGRVTSLSLFPDRYMLLCSTRDDTSLRLIDLRQNAITSTFSGFNLSTDWSRACFSPDGQYVAVGGSDGTIHIWEALTGRAHKVKKDSAAHSRDIVACCWHPKGQVFASVDRSKKLAIWKR